MAKDYLQELVLNLWLDEKLPIINGLLLNNGDFYSDIRNSPVRLSQTFDPNETDFNDWFSCIDIFQSEEYKNYKVYAGDGSHGSEGYVLVLTSDDKFLWLLFDEINPIERFEIKDDIIFAINNCGVKFILPIHHPEKYQVIVNGG